MDNLTDGLHLEVDLMFGPCNDPSCPGSKLATAEVPVDLSWPKREHLRLVTDTDLGVDE
jgi:hypothetical protein